MNPEKIDTGSPGRSSTSTTRIAKMQNRGVRGHSRMKRRTATRLNRCHVASANAPQQCRSSSCSVRSEEHTSELQSRSHLVCRLLLEKKKTNFHRSTQTPHHRT